MKQLNERTRAASDSIQTKIQLGIPALAWVAGLLLAGSDGPWMPYVNCAGGLIFLGATIWLGRVLPLLEPDVTPQRKRQGKRTIGRHRSCNVTPARHGMQPRFERNLFKRDLFKRDLGVI